MQVIWSNEQELLLLPSNMEELLHRVARRAQELFMFPAQSEVSIALVDDATIGRLNAEYRGKDGPTDVLSFVLVNEDTMRTAPKDQPLLLGDIVISMERAGAQAEAFGHSLEREVAFLLAHGLAHMAGLDHDADNEGDMSVAIEGILESLGICR